MRSVISYRYAVEDKCKAEVLHRDTYRYTGRGKSGFSMHYNHCQCSRKPVIDGFCLQHAKVAGLVK